jgi:hypothetical protein
MRRRRFAPVNCLNSAFFKNTSTVELVCVDASSRPTHTRLFRWRIRAVVFREGTLLLMVEFVRYETVGCIDVSTAIAATRAFSDAHAILHFWIAHVRITRCCLKDLQHQLPISAVLTECFLQSAPCKEYSPATVHRQSLTHC